jgi:Flp pilus assembly protein TadG
MNSIFFQEQIMKHHFSEKGQALILITFGIIALIGFTAVAVDGGRAFEDRRHAQNAADTAALTAALAKIKGENYTTSALNRAASNGYSNDSDSTVQVNLCSESGVTCANLPAGANPSEYIRVRITSVIPTTFMRVLGRNQITNTVEAIARAQGTFSSSSGGPMFNGAAMVATKGGNYNQCFLMNGSADLYTHNSGIYVNCSGSQALFINGGADLQMDAMGEVVGCFKTNGNASYDPITCNVNGGVSQNIDASTFADIPTTLPPPTCSSNGTSTTSGSTITFTPGNFTNITINSGKTAILTPGVYCISGSFNLNGNAQLKGPNGRVQLVLQNQNITLNGGGVINFNDLEIYGNNASFLLNGGALFHADRLRMFSTGSGTFTVNGGAELSSNDAYFYLNTGNITWNGSSILNLHAPPQGDPFAGLLVHMPWNSTTSGVTFNGGSDIHLYGTFLAPRRPITFNGGVNFELHSQIIGYTYIVNGGGDVDIYFQADENYSQPNSNSPTIELTK